jgi:hypothetical protein
MYVNQAKKVQLRSNFRFVKCKKRKPEEWCWRLINDETAVKSPVKAAQMNEATAHLLKNITGFMPPGVSLGRRRNFVLILDSRSNLHYNASRGVLQRPVTGGDQ